jgi:hypothetical protein
VDAEVRVDDPRIAAHHVRRAVRDDMAFIHDDHALAHGHDDVHVMLDEEEGESTFVAQLLHVLEQLQSEHRVHTRHRLVEHDHRGL